MTDPERIDAREARLLRFVDGRLPPAEAEAVAAEAAADPALAARLGADLAADAAIRAAYAPVADEPMPARLSAALAGRAAPAARPGPRPARSRPPRRVGALAAALLVGLAGGWAAGHFTAPGAPPDAAAAADLLPREAMRAYVTFAAEVRHPVEVPASEEAHLVQWLSRRLGAAVRAPALDAFGYALMGGRLLPAADGPAAQFLYETRDGQRLGLYVTRTPGDGETAFRFARGEGVAAFWWVDGGLGYALIGQTDRDHLMPIARAVYDHLQR